jgi:hypothetical protein
LTCSIKATSETNEFKALKKDADLITKAYQQKMRQSIVKMMEMDKATITTTLRHKFFDMTTKMVDKKVFYESMLVPLDSIFHATFKNTGGSQTASAYTCAILLDNVTLPELAFSLHMKGSRGVLVICVSTAYLTHF